MNMEGLGMGRLPVWQKARKKMGMNFYEIVNDHYSLALFNGKYVMQLECAKNNLHNDPDPHNWNIQDFYYVVGNHFEADNIARMMYNEQYKKKHRETMKALS